MPISKHETIARELDQATNARKCHACGCFQDATAAIEASDLGQRLRDGLTRARAVFRAREYDCLGCDVCWPANVLDQAAELVELPPHAGCATAIPEARDGWPPYPGDYRLGSYGAPVAVCTLHSHELVDELARLAPAGLALVGSLQTENLGIERIIQNVVANPNIRRLIVCGEDTPGRVGHFPGQSLLALAQSGISDSGRIIDAQGKRPVLANIDATWVAAFREQVEVIDHRDVRDAGALAALVTDIAATSPGPAVARDHLRASVRTVVAEPAERLVLDPAGYVVIYVDPRRRLLVAEHYQNRGAITTVIEGLRADDIMATLLAENLVTRLDHAAYLGRQLALAEMALQSGTTYRQDGAPEPRAAPRSPCCGGTP